MDGSDSARLFTVRVDDEEWRQTRSLSEAGPEDKVFVVDSTGRLVFGDGTRGRRPSGSATVTVTYREGGGTVGNELVSVTTRWPPPERRYVISLSSPGVRITRIDGTVERFDGVKRLSYFAGQVLSAADFQEEQQYLIGRRHLHNQALHGSGVVTGLSVTVSIDASVPSVVVAPGLALDRQGREIELAAPVAVAVGNPGGPQYVIVEYAERETDPSLTGDTGMVASRIEEGASIRLSPEAVTGDGVTLARLVADSAGWKVDSAFGPSRCR